VVFGVHTTCTSAVLLACSCSSYLNNIGFTHLHSVVTYWWYHELLELLLIAAKMNEPVSSEPATHSIQISEPRIIINAMIPKCQKIHSGLNYLESIPVRHRRVLKPAHKAIMRYRYTPRAIVKGPVTSASDLHRKK